jgi:hypothetical protein
MTARKLATYDDVLALPPHVVGQLVAGVLHAHPRPGSAHAKASSTRSPTMRAFVPSRSTQSSRP